MQWRKPGNRSFLHALRRGDAIALPGLSVIDLKRRLDAEGARLPVVLVTARTEPALHARAHAAGAICVLTKPFTADALLACVAKGVAGEDSTSD